MLPGTSCWWHHSVRTRGERCRRCTRWPSTGGQWQRQRRRLNNREASPLKTKASSLRLTLGRCPATIERSNIQWPGVTVTFYFTRGCGGRGGVRGLLWSPPALPVTAWHWAALSPTLPFRFDLSHPEICILSSYCMYEFNGKQNHWTEKDKSYAPKDEWPRWFLEDWIARLRFLPCRINGFMRITVPSVVHELSENIFLECIAIFF